MCVTRLLTVTGKYRMTSDSDKLRLLADWFDKRDNRAMVFNSEVQRDLRRIADDIDRFNTKVKEKEDGKDGPDA